MRIAIVEDETDAVEILKKFFKRYEKESGTAFVLDAYSDAVNFLTAYRSDYDLILFDIEMSHMDGMRGAEKLRELDPYVPIVFVTNMSNYAVKGYSVGAVDFIIKPVSYFDFKTMLTRVRRILASREEKMISVTSSGVIRHLPVSRIKYVEVYRHKLTFHTVEGNVEAWGSLADVAEQLPADGFSKCNNGFLVNLKYVDYVEKEEVIVGGERLPISHLRRKDFVNELAAGWGGGDKYAADVSLV